MDPGFKFFTCFILLSTESEGESMGKRRRPKSAGKASKELRDIVGLLKTKPKDQLVETITDEHMVRIISKMRERLKITRREDLPHDFLEFVWHIGGTGLGMSRRFSEGNLVILPSGRFVEKDKMDSNEYWTYLPLKREEDPSKLFFTVLGARTKAHGTPIFGDLQNFWKRFIKRDVQKENIKYEKSVRSLLSRFKQAKRQEKLFRLALRIAQYHGMFRGWTYMKVGTEAALRMRDTGEEIKEIGSRDLFVYGKPNLTEDRGYEGISVEIQSHLGTDVLRKIMYGLVKSVSVKDPRSNQEFNVRLVHNIIVVPENRVQKKIADLLKLSEWEKVERDIDGLFEPKAILDRMEHDKIYMIETIDHILKSNTHRSILGDNEVKILEDTLKDLENARPLPNGRMSQIREIINKIHRNNRERLTISFEVDKDLVRYASGKNINPAYASLLQYNLLLYFFSRGFKGDIKERVMRELLTEENRKRIINALESGKPRPEPLEINETVLKEVLDNMAKHIRKALQNTVLYLTDSKGERVNKIVIFKKDPVSYRVYPVIITPENKESLVYLEELKEHAEKLDKKIDKGEPVTEIGFRPYSAHRYQPKRK